jgi:hypothetical protein
LFQIRLPFKEEKVVEMDPTAGETANGSCVTPTSVETSIPWLLHWPLTILKTAADPQSLVDTPAGPTNEILFSRFANTIGVMPNRKGVGTAVPTVLWTVSATISLAPNRTA